MHLMTLARVCALTVLTGVLGSPLASAETQRSTWSPVVARRTTLSAKGLHGARAVLPRVASQAPYRHPALQRRDAGVTAGAAQISQIARRTTKPGQASRRLIRRGGANSKCFGAGCGGNGEQAADQNIEQIAPAGGPDRRPPPPNSQPRPEMHQSHVGPSGTRRSQSAGNEEFSRRGGTSALSKQNLQKAAQQQPQLEHQQSAFHEAARKKAEEHASPDLMATGAQGTEYRTAMGHSSSSPSPDSGQGQNRPRGPAPSAERTPPRPRAKDAAVGPDLPEKNPFEGSMVFRASPQKGMDMSRSQPDLASQQWSPQQPHLKASDHQPSNPSSGKKRVRGQQRANGGGGNGGGGGGGGGNGGGGNGGGGGGGGGGSRKQTSSGSQPKRSGGSGEPSVEDSGQRRPDPEGASHPRPPRSGEERIQRQESGSMHWPGSEGSATNQDHPGPLQPRPGQRQLSRVSTHSDQSSVLITNYHRQRDAAHHESQRSDQGRSRGAAEQPTSRRASAEAGGREPGGSALPKEQGNNKEHSEGHGAAGSSKEHSAGRGAEGTSSKARSGDKDSGRSPVDPQFQKLLASEKSSSRREDGRGSSRDRAEGRKSSAKTTSDERGEQGATQRKDHGHVHRPQTSGDHRAPTPGEHRARTSGEHRTESGRSGERPSAHSSEEERKKASLTRANLSQLDHKDVEIHRDDDGRTQYVRPTHERAAKLMEEKAIRESKDEAAAQRKKHDEEQRKAMRQFEEDKERKKKAAAAAPPPNGRPSNHVGTSAHAGPSAHPPGDHHHGPNDDTVSEVARKESKETEAARDREHRRRQKQEERDVARAMAASEGRHLPEDDTASISTAHSHHDVRISRVPNMQDLRRMAQERTAREGRAAAGHVSEHLHRALSHASDRSPPSSPRRIPR